MRTRTRVLLVFLGVHLVLSCTSGFLAWRWLNASMLSQAETSARSVSHIIGGLSLNDRVLTKISELIEMQLSRVSEGTPVQPGTIQFRAEGSLFAIDYRTAAYRHHRQQVLVGTLGLLAAGTIAFGLVGMALSSQLARPLEALARAARTIGGGDLEREVAITGAGEIRSLARELEQMRLRLVAFDHQRREAERLKTLGTFTATIAHEVRNPLSAVRLTVQMLARRLPQETSLQMVMSELERLDLIVDELLGFSKGMSVSPVSCDLRQAADAVVRLLTRQAEHAGVTLAVQGEGRAHADPARLRQLLMNLILNAIQAQHGAGAVRVLVGPRQLVVEDDGPGIPPAMASQLFAAFASGRHDGTGLGLHLAQAVALAHHATLRHEAHAPHGARFILEGLAADGALAPTSATQS
jgi:signal transduction histidine kinase